MKSRDIIINHLKSVDDLPTIDKVLLKVQQYLSSSGAIDSSIERIADVIREAPAIALKVLKVSNCPIYRTEREIVDIEDAVYRLGIDEVYRIVLTMATVRQFNNMHHIDYNQFWRHSITVALATSAIADFCARRKKPLSKKVTTAAFTAGLLHDTGILIMDQYFPDLYAGVLEAVSNSDDIPIYGVETEMLGISHSEVGSILMDRWGLPLSVVAAVGAHHSPETAGESVSIAELVHIADFACNNQGIGAGLSSPPLGFSDTAWNNLSLSVDSIQEIINKVMEESAKSEVLMALS